MKHDPFAPRHVAVRNDGTIMVNAEDVSAMGLHAGDRAIVRVTPEVLSERMRALGVTEDEVDAIGALQLESRDNVIRFLAAEGSLASRTGFRARVRSWLS